MKKTVFTGAATALVTPFNNTGVDYDSLENLVEFQIKQNIDAILACGTTGESSTMVDEEHLKVIKYIIDKVNGRVPVIAGTGSNHTEHAIKLTVAAEKFGADAILTVSPYYNKATPQGLFLHFKAIADSVSIPVILYNVPSRTGVNIPPSVVARLANECENIVALKECNLLQAADVIKLCPSDFSVYSGNDDQVLSLLAIGGKGVISVTSNIIPNDIHDMASLFLEGKIEASRKKFYNILQLAQSMFIEVNPIPVKHALNLMGKNAGFCRSPLCDLEAVNAKKLENQMKIYGLI